MAGGLGGSLISRVLCKIREYMEPKGVRNPDKDACLEAGTCGGD